jgi:hypothetical protein
MRRDRLMIGAPLAALLAGLVVATGCKGEPARPQSTSAPAPSTGTTTAPTTAPSAPSPSDSTPPAPTDGARTLVQQEVFRVDLAPLPACKTGETCEAQLVLHALAGFKVNADYPTKFVGDETSTVAVEGTGAFSVEDKTRGVLTVRFRPSAAGTARVSGAFKLSVCTDDVCKIEAPQVAFEIPVS